MQVTAQVKCRFAAMRCEANSFCALGSGAQSMSQFHFGFLLAAAVALAVTTMVSAGPVAGIVRTDGQPLETGPFDSHSTSAGQEIGHQFQSMYLTSQPNLWTKTFRWEIAGNTGLAPGQTLNITESIPLIYPDN